MATFHVTDDLHELLKEYRSNVHAHGAIHPRACIARRNLRAYILVWRNGGIFTKQPLPRAEAKKES